MDLTKNVKGCEIIIMKRVMARGGEVCIDRRIFLFIFYTFFHFLYHKTYIVFYNFLDIIYVFYLIFSL